MKKYISILGSTGSVGLSSLKIIDKKKNLFKLKLLSADSNFSLIKHQIRKYNPEIFVVNDFKVYEKLKIIFKQKNKNIKQF